MIRPIIVIALVSAVASASAATPRKAVAKPVAAQINIEAVVDSALIMADNYADAIAEKPEMAPTRLNVLRSYAGSKPAEARDSISSRLYAFFVNYTESEKAERAAAFRDCFLAVAPPDSPHLGPLYAAELQVAAENADTASLVRFIPMLDAYASRLGYDYDAELQAARARLNGIRNRRPIRDAIAGVWVSEDVAGLFDENSFNGIFKEEYPLVNSLAILQIRDTRSPIYDFPDNIVSLSLDSTYIATKGAVRDIDVVKLDGYMNGQNAWGSRDRTILDAWELPAHNMAPLDSSYISLANIDFIDKLSKGSKRLSRKVVADPDAYAIYAFWGDERLKRGDAEIAAVVRQSTQAMQASVAGQMSRGRYSFSESLAGNLTAGFISAGVNSIVDALMVSTDRIWSVETTLVMENPYCLNAIIYALLIESKSNSTKPEIYEYRHSARYYRWEESDNATFVALVHRLAGYPWTMEGTYYLHGVTNEEFKSGKEKRKSFEKDFEKWYKAEKETYKKRLNGLNKGSDEYERLKKEFDAFSKIDTAPKAWMKWNREQLARLKAKADNYKE